MNRATLPRLALSIRQPWAWAVIHGGKRIENRSIGAARHLTHTGVVVMSDDKDAISEAPKRRIFYGGALGGGKSWAATIAILTAQQRGITVRPLSPKEIEIADHLRTLQSFKPLFDAQDEVKK